MPGLAATRAGIARRLVEARGGRFSVEAGIDVDAGDGEVERWFLAATLFGTRISAAVAMRTYRVLDAAGAGTIGDAGQKGWDELVALLDQGGYTRYDFRTATRLLDLAALVAQRHPGGIAPSGDAARSPAELEEMLRALPGWGPVTTHAFLRELRGVWPAAQPTIDRRTVAAARHLGLSRARRLAWADLQRLAADARVDPRDLESALVRLALAHERAYERCAGGRSCTALRVPPEAPASAPA